MIFTDGTHLVSDTSEEELHAFAQHIGLKRKWYQKGHYDMTAPWRVHRAVAAGAKLTGPRVCALARQKMLATAEPAVLS